MPNIGPTPSPTPITGAFCKTFPAMAFEANRFNDLNLQVDELLSRIRGEENELIYHVDFGDGNKIYNKDLPYDESVGYRQTIGHSYLESDIYTARVAVDNKTTLRRSCADVEVYVFRDSAIQCSELHIQSNTTNGDQEFLDLSQSQYKLSSDSAIHSEQETVYGSSSVYLDGTNDTNKITVKNSATGFNFFHATPQRDFTIQTWINLEDVNPFNPIITNVKTAQDPGFEVFVKSGNVNFQISNQKGVANIANLKSDNKINSKQWYHIAAVKKDSTIGLFINGQKESEQTINIGNYTFKQANLDVVIGQQKVEEFPSLINLTGYLQDVRISQTADYGINGFSVPGNFISPECGVLPSFCPIFLLQSDNDDKSNEIKDASINEHRILPGQGIPYHSHENVIYGRSSIKFEEDAYVQTVERFNFLHQKSFNWTLQLWVYISSIETGSKIIGTTSVEKGNFPVYFLHNTSGSDGFRMYFKADRTIGFEIFEDNNRVLDLKTNPDVSRPAIQQWQHVSVTRIGSTYKMFINGSVAGFTVREENDFIDQNAEYRLRIGGGHINKEIDYNNIFNGYIQDLTFIDGNVLRSEIPPKTLTTTQGCDVLEPEEVPCPDIHIHSKNGEGSTFFQNYGSIGDQIKFNGIAYHTNQKQFFGQSTILTQGDDRYISTDYTDQPNNNVSSQVIFDPEVEDGAGQRGSFEELMRRENVWAPDEFKGTHDITFEAQWLLPVSFDRVEIWAGNLSSLDYRIEILNDKNQWIEGPDWKYGGYKNPYNYSRHFPPAFFQYGRRQWMTKGTRYAYIYRLSNFSAMLAFEFEKTYTTRGIRIILKDQTWNGQLYLKDLIFYKDNDTRTHSTRQTFYLGDGTSERIPVLDRDNDFTAQMTVAFDDASKNYVLFSEKGKIRTEYLYNRYSGYCSTPLFNYSLYVVMSLLM